MPAQWVVVEVTDQRRMHLLTMFGYLSRREALASVAGHRRAVRPAPRRSDIFIGRVELEPDDLCLGFPDDGTGGDG